MENGMEAMITVFVNPEYLFSFLTMVKVIQGLPIDSKYKPQINKSVFSEIMNANHVHVSLSASDYIKIKYYMEQK